jgi:methyl-accepting chemotaxis protein
MRMTITNKLLLGFGGVLLLLAAVAAVGIYSVIRLRHSAQETTRIGDRLNSISVEIQVHNLEAQRKAKSYFLEKGKLGEENARATYLDEATFEVHEIESLASKAVQLAPTAEIKAKFERINTTLAKYEQALNTAVEASQHNAKGAQAQAAQASYEEAAESLHEIAEDGEIAGHDVAQTFQEEIDRTSKRSMTLAVGFSIAGLVLALAASFVLARAILVPVHHLREVAENVSMGNLDIAVKRHSNDEIGDLAESFTRMVTAVKFFRMETELAQAEAAGAGGGTR